MKTTIHFLCVLLFSTILVGLYSCQKGDTPPPPDVVASVKDSTLLIKSIEYTVDGRPPLVESYDYDSVNRKVTLTWDDASGDYPKGYKIVLKYNEKELLTGSEHVFPTGYVPDSNNYLATEIVKTDILYDAENVLQSITTKTYNGTTNTIDFTKKNDPKGYQLFWKEKWDGSNNWFPSKAIFNMNGDLISRTFSGGSSSIGDSIISETYEQDSLIYDADGNITEIIRPFLDSAGNTDSIIVLAEFLERETEGDNLHNQRKTLLKGIANIPFKSISLFSPISGSFGMLSFYPGEIDNLEYYQFPFKTAAIYNFGTYQIETTNGISEIDDKGRLKKFTGFSLGTSIPAEYTITYYK